MMAGFGTWIADRHGRLRGQALVDAVAVISLAALFGDRVAIAWLPKMYGPDSALMLPGLAWLSFTVACFLLASVTLVRR